MSGQGFTSTSEEDFEKLSITVMQVKHQRDALQRVANAVVRGFEYDPGHPDLDNEQPIHVSMTLGDYRRARRLLHELEKS